jgi:hypothetical protein
VSTMKKLRILSSRGRQHKRPSCLATLPFLRAIVTAQDLSSATGPPLVLPTFSNLIHDRTTDSIPGVSVLRNST